MRDSATTTTALRTPPLWPDRFLSAVGTEDEQTSRTRRLAFARVLLLLVAVESVESLHYWNSQPAWPLHVALAVVLLASAIAGWHPRWTRTAALVSAAGMLAHNLSAFPLNANHHYLQLICLALVALIDGERHEERLLLLRTLRWLAVIGLVWAGIQKAWYGYYFGGEFLAYTVSGHARFADLFRPLMPAAEWMRLRELTVVEGAGPFRVDAPWFVAASNVAWLGELVLPTLLLFRRTRPVGLGLTIAYIVAIEMGARELFFGILILSMVLLFGERDWNRRLLPFFVLALLWLLAVSAGLLPRWYFT